MLGVNIRLATLGTVCSACFETHGYVRPISIWDVKEPPMTTNTLAMTTLNAA